MPLGAHMSIAGGLYKALLRGREMGCECVQLFVRSNMAWHAGRFGPADVEKFAKAREETGIAPLVAHNCYLVNLASTDARTRRRSLEATTGELQRAQALGIPYLVIHPGAHLGAGVKAGIRKVARGIDRCLRASRATDVMILLETTAGAGTLLGRTFEELAEVIAASSFADRIGVCADTCHLLAAGYDIRTRAGYVRTFKEFRNVLGLKKLRCFHLNDSKGAPGSHRDRHEHVGKGTLGEAAFGFLLNDPRFEDLPMILETPKGTYRRRPWDKINLDVLRKLRGDERYRL